MSEMKSARRLALGLAAAAAAWPSVYGALTYAFASPLERALFSAWCGSAPHDGAFALLGHCAPCWTGSAALMAAALALALVRPREPRASL